jgi:transketolase
MPVLDDRVTHDEMANAIRALAMDAMEKAKSGHPGLPMGAADIATVLFTKVLKYYAAGATWPDRDRFVLSAGHGSMLLYALLYLTGEPSMTNAELQRFRQLGSRTPGHPEWKAALNLLPTAQREEFERRLRGDLPVSFGEAVTAYKRKLAEDRSPTATRKASEATLEVLAKAGPELLTGSADLTPSNNTKVAATPDIELSSYSGRKIQWGVREHGMAAAVNGIALHGGFIPLGASFLTFSDYCRPAPRLSALMGAIEVFAHDSIGFGEDGPTHQPIEHLAALRAIPNLRVFRPADRTETLECWQLAVEAKASPSVLVLTRQNLPSVRRDFTPENLPAAGPYELAPADGGPAKVSIFASGSEVSIALEAQIWPRGVFTRASSRCPT